MPYNRRDFLKSSAAATALVFVSPNDALASGRLPARWTETESDELMAAALGAAKAAGATYADVRIGRYRSQNIGTRERQITGVSDAESYGMGIRTIVNGAWGFAATSVMTTDGVAKVAREAARLSRAAGSVQKRKIELAPTPVVKGTWQTPVKRDPLEVSIEDKVALLFAANDAALKVPGIRFVNSGLQLLREIKQYANTEGTQTTQTFIRVGPSFSATAVGNGGFQQYGEELAPRGEGWEYVESLDMPGNAAKWASLAVEKLGARSVEPGRYDLIITPENLWLTIHESIGHPTELDRALGYEANYAGTSFIAPPEAQIGKLRYGRPLMNIQGDRTQEGSLARCAWDDEGVAADSWRIVDKGIFKDYQTTREQASTISRLTGVTKSHGCSFADSWDSVQFQRMPNISLMPSETNTSMNDIIAATDRGIIIKNRGSWSIDHQRYNFQFSGQAYYEVRGGKITGMLKDVAYQSTTPVFWNSMDMIGGKDSYWLGGSFGDGKGQPGQSNSVSHGCPPARFRQVNVVNTGRGGLMSSAPKSLFAAPLDGDYLTRDQAKALADRVLAFARADETRVNIATGWSGNTRFAGNEITTSGGTTNTSITVTSTIGKRRASSQTNILDDASLRRTVEFAESLARLSPDNPELVPELGAQDYAVVSGYFESSAGLDPEKRAAATKSAIAAAESAGGTGADIFVAGFLEANAGANAVATSRGLFAYHRSSSANLGITARTPDGTGSGWSNAGARDWNVIDAAALGRTASAKAAASRNPRAIEPGLYTVVLEPAAVSDIMGSLFGTFNARANDEGRGTFSKPGGGTKLGEKIADERVTMYSDPTDPDLLAQPFAQDGTPVRRVTYIEKGILKEFGYDRYWAQKQGKVATGGGGGGFGGGGGGGGGFGGGAVKFVGGTQTTAELIASTKRGILVTHFFYIRPLDQRTVMLTGLTRDGTFLIENGKITAAVKNFRWNESPLFMLSKIEEIGRAEPVGAGRVMPSLKAKDFNFTSLSDAV